MEWESDARAAIERAPFFVRRLARRKVEELVRSEGRQVVTLSDVRRGKPTALQPTSAEGASSLGESPIANVAKDLPTGPEGASPSTVERSDDGVFRSGLHPSAELEPDSGLTEEQIRLIEGLVEQIPSLEARFWSAKACGGAVGCPLAVVDVRAAIDAVAETIDRSGLSEARAARRRGPTLSHHRFKAAVAGCANCCSEPQIKDFALVARARPTRGSGDCHQCGACEKACREAAVGVVDVLPVFDGSRCIGCGGCAEACEHDAIVGRVGYDVLVGGRLGRHARLAETVAAGVSLEEGLALLRASLGLLVAEGLAGERLGALLERIGFDRLRVT